MTDELQTKMDKLKANVSPPLEEALARFNMVVDEVQRLDQRRSAIFGALERAQNENKQQAYAYAVEPDKRAKELQKLTDNLEMEATRVIGRTMSSTKVNLESLKATFLKEAFELKSKEDQRLNLVVQKAMEKYATLAETFHDQPIEHATQLRSLIDQSKKNAAKAERENEQGYPFQCVVEIMVKGLNAIGNSISKLLVTRKQRADSTTSAASDANKVHG
jgi:hypothetical protein